MANPPNAPSPPTHPAAPPTASGTSWATSLNTAALAPPMPMARKISATTERPKAPERVIISAPASMKHSARIPVGSPPSRSERTPRPARTKAPGRKHFLAGLRGGPLPLLPGHTFRNHLQIPCVPPDDRVQAGTRDEEGEPRQVGPRKSQGHEGKWQKGGEEPGGGGPG